MSTSGTWMMSGRWGPPIVALAMVSALTVLEPRSKAAAAFIVLASVVQAAANAFVLRADTRAEASFGLLLGVYVGVPFTRLTGASTLILAVLVSSLLLALSCVRLDWRASRTPIAALLGLFVAGTVIVTFLAPDKNPAIRSAIWAVPIIVGLSISLLGEGLRPKEFARVVVSVGLFEAVLALVQLTDRLAQLWAPAQRDALGLPRALMNPFLEGVERTQGTLGHPLALGFLLMVSVGLTLDVLSTRRPLLATLITMVLGAGLVVAGSRFSLMASLGLFVFWVVRRSGAAASVIALCAGAAAFVYIQATTTVLVDLITSLTRSGSYTHRRGSLDALLRVVFDTGLMRSFLGNGLGSNPRLYRSGVLQQDGFEVIDNQYVQTLSHSGLLGLLLLVGAITLAVRRAPRSLLPTIVAVLFNMAVFDLLLWPSAALITTTLLGLAVTGSDHRPVVTSEGPAPPARYDRESLECEVR